MTNRRRILRKRSAGEQPSTKTRTAASLAALGAALALGGSGVSCGGEGGACLSDRDFFAQKVWAPIVSTKCYSCHSGAGIANKTKFVLKSSADAGFLDINYQVMKEVASYEKDGESILLLKPTARVDHYGGHLVKEGSEEESALKELVSRFDNPSGCSDDDSAYFESAELKTPKETLRKASLLLVGRLPTAQEYASLTEDIDSVTPVLYHYMEQDGFYERLREVYNDQFLTDRYMGGSAALDIIQSDEYNPYWYEDPAQIGDKAEAMTKYGQTSAGDLYDAMERWTNRGVAREPIELIVHVVKNDRPFTEILTADYFMVNPFSAKAWGLSDVSFENNANPNEYQEARRAGFPHAGVLSSPVWLTRFPTTPTNRNRHRARMVLKFFLGTDILKTAEQPIDPTKATGFNPTMFNPSCTVCHTVIDPLAGAFHNFNEQGDYDPEDPWLNDMRPPGFGADLVPYEEFPRSLPWVGQKLAEDDRFAVATVQSVYKMLTGQKPLIPPDDPTSPTFARDFDEYLVQYHEFGQMAQLFQYFDYDFKILVAMIVKSQYFRAKNATTDDPATLDKIRELGSSQFLTPEHLHRKVEATLGIPWRPEAYQDYDGQSYDYLLRTGEYRLLYGGIDSDDVTIRATDPNGIMANIAERMSNEMACKAVPLDFNKAQADRLLFTKVEKDFQPKDLNGFEIAEAKTAIQAQIKDLYLQILGEEYDVADPEVQRAYDLFVQTWEEGTQALKAQTEGYDSYLPYPCQVNEDYWTKQELPDEQKLQDDSNYTIRSWMAVVAYMLGDYSFLYE